MLIELLSIASLIAGSESNGAFDNGAVKQGMQRSIACQACHGGDGISVAASVPNLAGQNAEYLVAQLSAFKAGTRKHDIMNPIARQLNEGDIQNLAAFWSRLPATGTGRAADNAALLARTSKMTWPKDFPKEFVAYRIDDDKEGGTIATYWANKIAIEAARDQHALPEGSIVITETRAAKRDSGGNVISDATGNLAGDAATGYSGMEILHGAGNALPALIRNGDWTYALFDSSHVRNETFNYAMCLGCHKSVASENYLFTFKWLKERNLPVKPVTPG